MIKVLITTTGENQTYPSRRVCLTLEELIEFVKSNKMEVGEEIIVEKIEVK